MPHHASTALKAHSPAALHTLIQAGVQLLDATQVWIDARIPLKNIAKGAVLYPGVRLLGEATRVDEGAVLGAGGVVTLDNSWVGEHAQVGGLGATHLQHTSVGPHAVLGAGSAENAVFLGLEVDAHQQALGSAHTCGFGFRARNATLYEEGASSAQFTDCKMAILMPWVTLGGHINFCDALVGGGYGAALGAFSEIGSGSIHFNFTPRGDKATGSCFGNVRQGVLLNQAPLFIGGNASLIGPLQADFGALTPAGGNYRGVLKPGLNPANNPSSMQPKPEFDTQTYGQVSRTITTQLQMLAELMVLRTWYVHMRLQVSAGWIKRHQLYQHAERVVCQNLAERSTQLLAMLARLETSLAKLQEAQVSSTDVRVAQQKAALKRAPALAKALQRLQQASPQDLLAPPAAVQQAFVRHWDAAQGVYTTAVQGLVQSEATQPSRWLEAVYQRALAELKG